MINNQSHKSRFINNQNTVNGGQQQNKLAYVKGQDFNSQDKYDFNIISNEQRQANGGGSSTLRNAAS